MMDWACRTGAADIASLALDYGADWDYGEDVDECDKLPRNKYGLERLNIAARNGNIEVVKVLIQKCNDITKNDLNRALTSAISLQGQLQVAMLLVEEGADINTQIMSITLL
jgi:ankyrin repeat protein